MPVEITVGTPLANALNGAIQGKIAELGWVSGGAEDAAMAEYFVLMLANGKTQDEIAAEISGDLLGLGPDDPTAPAFARWVFEQIDSLGAQLNTGDAPGTTAESASWNAGDASAASITQDDLMDGALPAGFTDTDMSTVDDGSGELNVPTGPKAMRNGGFRGGREKRMLGHINRALDRTANDPLHRVRTVGNERISRAAPSGPRGIGRQPRMSTNGRAASIAHGMGLMGPSPGLPPMNGVMNHMNMNGAMNAMPNGGINGVPNGGMNAIPNGFMMPGQPDIFAMMEQQSRLLQSMQAQLMMQQNNGQADGTHVNNHGHGKSLFERTSRPASWRRGGAYGHHDPSQNHNKNNNNNNNNNSNGNGISHNTSETSQSSEPANGEGEVQNEDVDMGGNKREPANPEETICKFNLRCTNKDCKFAHQSPAAPPGITIDVKDTCSYGAACKNHKCVGRHPSPVNKVVHQNEQDCKFFPNCTNPRCPFRHPAMPPCRNGGECKVPNCKFTHVKTPCKYRPCTNRFCPFSHEEGQRGTFHDKVWTAGEGGGKDEQHVSERKFVAEGGEADLVLPDDEGVGADVIV